MKWYRCLSCKKEFPEREALIYKRAALPGEIDDADFIQVGDRKLRKLVKCPKCRGPVEEI